jgi:putative toxin-antitoxin system antitoxin component (TIGR02293 family)
MFRPLGPLTLAERQKVRLTISDTQSALAALTREMEKVQGELSPTALSFDAASITVQVARILPVIAHTVAVFGDEQKASHWMETPLPLLGGRSPSELLETTEGIELVEQILTRIEHNIPS